jgi:RND family efflux transporter MFP subunit
MLAVLKIKQICKDKRSRCVIVGILLAILVSMMISRQEATTQDAPLQAKPVTLITANEYVGQNSLSLLGTTRAHSEAEVTSEVSGRVVNVNVGLGDQVTAGTVLATLENASERAAVLQAEGVYEAALAAAAQSQVGVTQAGTGVRAARDNAVSIFQSSYNTSNQIIRDTVDDFFSNPSDTIPGLRIDGRGYTGALNAERVNYQTLLTEWQRRASDISLTSDLNGELQYAKDLVRRTIALLDTFLTVFATQENTSRYSDSELQGFITDFTIARTSLLREQSAIDNALVGLEAATSDLTRAELSSSGSRSSAADAQVKQALGTLRAAEANLAKTILRTPINGTVNSLTVRTGDFISSFSPIALIANNSAIEIVTFVTEPERKLLTVGDTVMIEDEYEGVITAIAPSVDNNTRKIEVRISSEAAAIVSGDTVRVTKVFESASTTTSAVIIPLSAVRFELENGFVFLVENDAIIARPVTVGTVRGGTIEILEGLSATEAFIKDVRGLVVGMNVTVIK